MQAAGQRQLLACARWSMYGRALDTTSDGARTYFKMDGYEASTTVEVGDGDVLHVLLAPTPFADYVNDEWRVANGAPVPCYGYRYAVEVAESGTASPPRARRTDTGSIEPVRGAVGRRGFDANTATRRVSYSDRLVRMISSTSWRRRPGRSRACFVKVPGA